MSKLSADLIRAVHLVEEKYGSVRQAPNKCPELQVCHQIVSRMPFRRIDKEKDEIRREIRDLFNAGYTRYEAATMVGVSYNTVSEIIRNSDFSPIQRVYEFYADGHLVTVGTFIEIAKVYHDMNPETLRKLQYGHPERYHFVKVGERHGLVNAEN